MGKDHRKGKAVSDAQRAAFGMGVLTGRREARPISDYSQPGDEEKRMREVRQQIEDRKLARELGVPLEAVR